MKITPETPKIDLGSNGHAVLKAYFALLLLGGHVGLPLALGTMFASRTAGGRYPTLINMLVSWIVYATAALLLFYAGESQNRQPDFGLCLAQAALVYGSTVMVGVATLCLVIQLWIELRGREIINMPTKRRYLLMILPWLSIILISAFVAAYGVINTSKVSYRWQFYCTISSNAVVATVAGLTIVSLGTMVFFQASSLLILYKAARQIRAANRSSYNMSLRVSMFASYTLITFIIAGINVLISELIFPYIFISTLPLTAFAIFGTTKDNVTTWTRCLKRRRENKNAIRLEPIAFRPNRETGLSTTRLSTSFDNSKPASVLDSVGRTAAEEPLS